MVVWDFCWDLWEKGKHPLSTGLDSGKIWGADMTIQTHKGENLNGTNKVCIMGTEVGMWKQNEKMGDTEIKVYLTLF